MPVSFLNTADKIMENYENSSYNKMVKSPFEIMVAAVLAGMFIAFGASSSNVAAFGIEDVGMARTLTGCVFPVGLMLIVLVGGELFTGDCLMFAGFLDRRYKARQMARVLIFVYLGNLLGSAVLAWLIACSGQWNYGSGALAAYTIKIAYGKVHLSFGSALISGILCNILVCFAVLTAGAAKDVTGKIWGCFFPILAFVLAGYEHCVANMYYIVAGIIAASKPEYAAKAMELYGYTEQELASLNFGSMFAVNLLPVTIGNIVGGMVFVAMPMYYLTKKRDVKKG
ncbi:MAG: formate/nitrite transporter family protein [Lachnospiraceae bacterium]|nr:formate/nitrite transporter family protein [Lachnospiraceae bacterium]